mmetsp:Transcript_31167/g.57806  ORF Transcript_31167/g.57806 Transcript_31167/m.57806 type:complete len:258 (-) Transcript_31167:193-966(-)
MDLMLEECVIQIAIEPGMKGRGSLGPLNVQFEFQSGTRLDLGEAGRLGGEIDLDDAIGIVTNVKRALGINVSLELPAVLAVLRHRLLQVTEIVPEVLSLRRVQIREHLAHHPPHGQIVHVHLVKPLILGRRREQPHLIDRQGSRRARLQHPALGRSRPRINQIVTAVTERVTAETLSDAVGLEGVPRSPLVVGMVARVRSAVGEDVVLVRLLRVGVRADFVHPEIDVVSLLVAVIVLVGVREEGHVVDCRREERDGE